MIRKAIIVLLTFLSIIFGSCLALSHLTPYSWRWVYEGDRFRIHYYKGAWGIDNHTASHNYAVSIDKEPYKDISCRLIRGWFLLIYNVEFDPKKTTPPSNVTIRIPWFRNFWFRQRLYEKLPYQGKYVKKSPRDLTPIKALQYETVMLDREISATLWPFVLLFFFYPAIVFIRGPLRRWRRRRKGLCLKCGYNLSGNTTGICSECGEAI